MPVETKNTFSCIIIGCGTLPINCAEILLRAGHEIKGIATSDPKLQRWAVNNGISSFDPGAGLVDQIQEPFDHLFSIVNEYILRPEILALARGSAINYHDAPLPRYAGTHATSWALLNGEKTHGITWHLITDRVDAGDILKQRHIDVVDSDTAFSLNTKCYEAAIEAFGELVDDLSEGTLTSRRQNLEERTFFARFKRPPNGSLISWNKPACEISALVRALNFGDHPNPLGAAKIFLGNECFIVQDAEISGAAASCPPGVVSGLGMNHIQVSTADWELIIHRLSRLDGWPVAISELTEIYELKRGFQLSFIDGDTLQQIDTLYAWTCKHEAFWAERLSSLEPLVAPFANAVAEYSTEHTTVPMRISSEVSDHLDSISPPERIRFLISAYVAFLARINSVERFDIGYMDAESENRSAGLNDLFARYVPARFDIDCRQNFARLLKDIDIEVETVKEHKTFASDMIARYPPLRSDSGAAGFTLPVGVAVSHRPECVRPATGNELTLAISSVGSKQYWIFDRSRVSSDDIARLTEHFNTFLKSLVSDNDKPIAEHSLLNETQQHKILVEWNSTRVQYPSDKCIHQLFEEQVERTPEATAVIFGEHRITYSELNRRANRLATHLRNLGVEAETLVGVCLGRSIDLIVGIMAVLKAGGAYVPLDPAYPKERLQYTLKDSKTAVILTQQKFLEDVGPVPANVVCIERDRFDIEGQLAENLVAPILQNNLAYVIYTSGSTGRPKGVAIEHRSVVAFLSWALSTFTIDQLRGVLASTSVCFDLSIFEIFAPLSGGGTVILVENVLYLPEAPSKNEVTLINTVPSAITELLRMNGIPSSVRTVNLAGEPLKSALVRQIYDVENIREVFDLYGPSEDTTYSTYALRNLDGPTIGRPISNTQAYILDRYMKPVPIGIAGELYLGGDGLARGYLNRPELTAERFINDPFDCGTRRLYKTGDLVRYLPSGEIEYLGRIDNQVKIRGFRIELGEIESCLLAHPSIGKAVVTTHEAASGEKRLAAYYVLAQPIRPDEIRDLLKQKLPDHMIPAAFVELDDLPLTPNGKIDRKALPPPSTAAVTRSRDFIAPRNSVETKLAEIWQRILKLPEVSVSDNFFRLGGDSLQAVSLFVDVEDMFGKHLPLTALIETPTIEKMAAVLDNDSGNIELKYLVPLKTGGSNTPLFCMHAAGGNVLFYRDLASELPDNQPVYGLQARGVADKSETAHDNVEDMAMAYLAEIRTVQPAGPYLLCGSSFGGLVAYEMACLLEDSGEAVSLLALFDTFAPGYPKLRAKHPVIQKFSSIAGRALRTREQIGLIRGIGPKARFIGGMFKKIQERQKRQKIWEANQFAVEYAKATGRDLPIDLQRNHSAIQKAMNSYQPRRYHGELTIYRARIQPTDAEFEPELGWSTFTGGVIRVTEVRGTHGALTVFPYANGLAEALSASLPQSNAFSKAA